MGSTQQALAQTMDAKSKNENDTMRKTLPSQ